MLKIGEVVRVKTWAELKRDCRRVERFGLLIFEGNCFVEEMKKYCGRLAYVYSDAEMPEGCRLFFGGATEYDNMYRFTEDMLRKTRIKKEEIWQEQDS